MRIVSLDLRGYRAIGTARFEFNERMNRLIGGCGSGKSTVLKVLAGVCGTDEATDLITGSPVGSCEIVLDDNGTERVFKVDSVFDEDAILDFKSSLGTRVSFPLSTSGSFPSDCCDYATVRKTFLKFCEVLNLPAPCTYDPRQNEVRFGGGSGAAQAFMLFLLDSSAGVPVLMDNPDTSLDHTSQEVMMDFLDRQERQLIYATHSPFMDGKAVATFDLGGTV